MTEMAEEMTEERIHAQMKIQSLMNVLIRSMVDRVSTHVEDEFEDIIEEDELDIIIALSFLRGAVDIALYNEVEKTEFMRLCSEIFDSMFLHFSTPAGNA
jgi:hypothetical protein